MSSSQSTYPLRLPLSVKAEVVRRAKAEGISVNQFVATAVAEKLAAMNTAAFFAERQQRADFDTFDQLLSRQGGEPPATDDEIPPQPDRTANRDQSPRTGGVATMASEHRRRSSGFATDLRGLRAARQQHMSITPRR